MASGIVARILRPAVTVAEDVTTGGYQPMTAPTTHPCYASGWEVSRRASFATSCLMECGRRKEVMQNWYLVFTKPHKEPLVNRQLEDRGLETFFPYLQYERGYGRGIRLEAFFPNYLFVKVDLEAKEANGLTWLGGIRNLVSFDGRPVQVPAPVVEVLRARLIPYADKVLDKEEMLFQPGDAVKVTSGPFASLEGVFQKSLSGQRRVQILLNLLGGWTRVELHSEHVELLTKRGLALPIGGL
jgi:transcriptional antiterminator RfaH